MKWKFISDPIILIMRSTYEHQDLRFCKTAITWLRSLLAIFWSLFWRHDIAKQHHICCKDLRNVLWCHEIPDVFLRNMAYVLQNVQFSQYFTMKLTFSLFTWLGSPIFLFYLLVSKTNFLWSVFSEIWLSDFLLWWVIWFKSFHFVVICT